MKFVDRFLNNITMYRLLVYSLGILASLGIVFAFMGRVSATPTELVISLFTILAAAYITDRGIARLFSVPTNMESALITSLILFLILQPADSVSGVLALAAAGAISSVSKFIVAWNARHIFNPAAFAAAAVSLTGLQATTWWVGSSVFWPFTLVLGLAVVRKIRRFPLFITFVITSTIVQYIVLLQAHVPLGTGMKHALIASPLIFLSTIMLTEPATMPWRRNLQMMFAALVALLYATGWEIGPLIVYPEVALLLGNIFAFAVSPKFRVRLQLKEIRQISDHIYHYIFRPERQFTFLPGQYMEWTLAGVPYDARGNRRTFTIASSPTEPEVQLGLKYYEPASMYKAAFSQLKPGDTVYGSQLAGNFTLPTSDRGKLAFIAGGIGITPFRSMVKYLTDSQQQVDIILLYVVSNPGEFAYMQELREAEAVGVHTVLIVTNLDYHSPQVVTAKLSSELLQQLVPDYAERTFYISGPNAMVDAGKGYLRALHVPRRRVRTDHFSGY